MSTLFRPDSVIPFPSVVRTTDPGRAIGTVLFPEDAAQVTELLKAGPGDAGWSALLEHRVMQAVGAHKAFAFNSPGGALAAVLSVLELKPDDEVIVPADVSIQTANVIRHFDAHPILVDVLPDSLAADPEAVRDSITDRTRAILITGAAGREIPLTVWKTLTEPSGAVLIEDLRDEPLCLRRDSQLRTGHLRLFACPSGLGTAAPSGAVVCLNDPRLADRMASALADRCSVTVSPVSSRPMFQFVDRLSEPAALWLCSALEHERVRWLRRCEIAASYDAACCSRIEIQQACAGNDAPHGRCDYLLRLNLQYLSSSREQFAAQLRRRGVPLMSSVHPVLLSPEYQQAYSFVPETFPLARNEVLRQIGLPIHAMLTDEDVDGVVNALLEVTDACRRR